MNIYRVLHVLHFICLCQYVNSKSLIALILRVQQNQHVPRHSYHISQMVTLVIFHRISSELLDRNKEILGTDLISSFYTYVFGYFGV